MATIQSIRVEGIIPLLVKMESLAVQMRFGVVENVAVDISLGTIYIDRCITGTFPMDRELYPYTLHF